MCCVLGPQERSFSPTANHCLSGDEKSAHKKNDIITFPFNNHCRTGRTVLMLPAHATQTVTPPLRNQLPTTDHSLSQSLHTARLGKDDVSDKVNLIENIVHFSEALYRQHVWHNV